VSKLDQILVSELTPRRPLPREDEGWRAKAGFYIPMPPQTNPQFPPNEDARFRRDDPIKIRSIEVQNGKKGAVFFMAAAFTGGHTIFLPLPEFNKKFKKGWL